MPHGFAAASIPSPSCREPVDVTAISQRLKDCFASLKDPRVERSQLHQLCDVLAIAILSMIAGGMGWEDMELYGLSKLPWLSTFLLLPNGIPSPDTLSPSF